MPGCLVVAQQRARTPRHLTRQSSNHWHSPVVLEGKGDEGGMPAPSAWPSDMLGVRADPASPPPPHSSCGEEAPGLPIRLPRQTEAEMPGEVVEGGRAHRGVSKWAGRKLARLHSLLLPPPGLLPLEAGKLAGKGATPPAL